MWSHACMRTSIHVCACICGYECRKLQIHVSMSRRIYVVDKFTGTRPYATSYERMYVDTHALRCTTLCARGGRRQEPGPTHSSGTVAPLIHAARDGDSDGRGRSAKDHLSSRAHQQPLEEAHPPWHPWARKVRQIHRHYRLRNAAATSKSPAPSRLAPHIEARMSVASEPERLFTRRRPEQSCAEVDAQWSWQRWRRPESRENACIWRHPTRIGTTRRSRTPG